MVPISARTKTSQVTIATEVEDARLAGPSGDLGTSIWGVRKTASGGSAGAPAGTAGFGDGCEATRFRLLSDFDVIEPACGFALLKALGAAELLNALGGAELLKALVGGTLF
jgi:hypothetical protein